MELNSEAYSRYKFLYVNMAFEAYLVLMSVIMTIFVLYLLRLLGIYN